MTAAFYVFAQEKLPPEHHAPDREFHAINIDLNLKFDFQKKEVFGTAVEKIVPLRVNLDTIHLDAVDMAIDKVVASDKPLGYKYDGKTLAIGLPRSYGLDDTLTYAITYSTFPKKGIFFRRTRQRLSQSDAANLGPERNGRRKILVPVP